MPERPTNPGAPDEDTYQPSRRRERSTTWAWIGNELIDPGGVVVARVSADVIHCGQERILVESTPGIMGFRARGTTVAGEVFSATHQHLTITKVDASCGERNYRLLRDSPWRKARTLYAGDEPIARVRPLISGRVEVLDIPGAAEIPLSDFVFLTWVCVLIDSPVRRPVAAGPRRGGQ